MSFQAPEQFRLKQGPRKSDASYGNNGVFVIPGPPETGSPLIVAIASDGAGWEHVSVSLHKHNRYPNWIEMSLTKALFWGPDDTVVQIHPRRDRYVEVYPGCLHLWRKIGQEYEVPNKELEGQRMWKEIMDPKHNEGE